MKHASVFMTTVEMRDTAARLEPQNPQGLKSGPIANDVAASADSTLSRAATPSSQDTLRILRLPQVCEVTGLCRSMIYQMEADLRFPQRIKIGVRAVGWLENEVNAWLIMRITSSRSGR
jgi:prophage regulatory protein